MNETLKIYDTVVTMPGTKKEMWMQFVAANLIRGGLSFDELHTMALRDGIEISKSWAKWVALDHMKCMNGIIDNGSNIDSSIPNDYQIGRWRRGGDIPGICMRSRISAACLSSPLGNTRCPILYGNSLVVERDGENTVINGRPFGQVSLLVGDGPMIEALQRANNPQEGVIVVDPQLQDMVNVLNRELGREGLIDSVKQVLAAKFIGLHNLSDAAGQAVEAIYAGFVPGGNIFPIAAPFDVLRLDTPLNCFNKIYFSYPPGMQERGFWDSLVELSMAVLKPGGELVIRTESPFVWGSFSDSVMNVAPFCKPIRVDSSNLPCTLYSS